MTEEFVEQGAASASPQLRHHLECLPSRQAPRPRWEPTIQRDAAPEPKFAALSNMQLVVAQDLGPVRINFRYAGYQWVSSAYSEKAKRIQYLEGINESYGFRLHEMDPKYVDLQYQPAALTWNIHGKKAHRMVFDYAVELDDGQIVFGEDKASDAFFSDPMMKERLDLAEHFLRRHGVKLERRVAGGLPSALVARHSR